MIRYVATTSEHPGQDRVIELDTIEQALLFACSDLRTGSARPVGIYDSAGSLLHDSRSIQDRCIELVDEQ